MMHCKDWEERVALHVGGDLAAADAAAVERHLAECAGCRMLWAGIKQSLEMLQGAHAEAEAPGIYTAVRGRVLAELAVRRMPWWRRGWVVGLAAAVVAMVVGLANWPGPKVEMPPPLFSGDQRVVAVIPPAPSAQALRAVLARPLPHKPRVVAAVRAGNPQPRQPLMVRLVTDDPNIVIYWIAD